MATKRVIIVTGGTIRDRNSWVREFLRDRAFNDTKYDTTYWMWSSHVTHVAPGFRQNPPRRGPSGRNKRLAGIVVIPEFLEPGYEKYLDPEWIVQIKLFTSDI